MQAGRQLTFSTGVDIDMDMPNQMREALARLEQRRIELEREITDEIDRKYFADVDHIDLTTALYTDPPLTADEQTAWDEIVARY